jgi:hypothetical protein
LIARRTALILMSLSQEVRMKKFLLAGVAAIAIAGSTVVYAQHRQWSREQTQMNPADKAAFADARIAAVHAGLKLTSDQEKLWPPVEASVRDLVKIRIDRANARMTTKDDAQKPDPVTRLRTRADNMATSAAAMKKIADAADPLYKTLDDGQKRRLAMLTHMGHRHGGRGGEGQDRGGGWQHRGGFQRGMDGDRGDRGGRGFDRDGGRDYGGRGGSERL